MCVTWFVRVAVNDVWFGVSTLLLTRKLEALASQLSTLRAPFSDHACVNIFLLFQKRRNDDQRQPGKNAHTCIDHDGNNVR